MSSVKSKLADNLKQITEYCNDSISGYNSAADSIEEENTILAKQFKERAAERVILSQRLSNRLRDIGEDGEDSGTFRGAIHRGMLKLREIVSGKNVEAVVKECLRGENELQDMIVETKEECKTDGHTTDLLNQLNMHVDQSIRELESIKA